MQKTFRALFNLLPGEGPKTSLFALLSFLWSYGVYGCLILSEGLFLENVGADNLPKVYFFLAATMCLFSGGLIFSLRTLSVNRLLLVILSTTAAVYALLTLFLLQTNLNHGVWVWYVFRMMGTVFPLSIYVCYWAFVDQFYDLQDGKRIFCLYNATCFLGDACAGATISWGLSSFGLCGLLFFFVALVLVSIPFVRIIIKKCSPILEAHVEGLDSTSETTFRSLFSSILRSRFTLILMFFYFVMQVLAICTEYNCFEVFEEAFASKGEHGLTQFLGTCTAWISLANTLFGLFLYSRLTKKLGVNNITLIAPIFFLIVFVCWSFNSVLAVAVLGIIAREGMTYTFDDNNLNLLVTGVPTKIKNQVRISIESFFEPFGTFISGLLLLSFQMHSKTIGLVLALFALGLALVIRSSYPRAIFKNLLATTVQFQKKSTFKLHAYSKQELRKIKTSLLQKLKRGEEEEQLLALESLVKIEQKALFPRLLYRIDRMSLKGKLQAVDILSHSPFSHDPRLLSRMERWKINLPLHSLQQEIDLQKARQGLVPLSTKQIQERLQARCLKTVRATAYSLKSLSPATLTEIAPTLLTLLQKEPDSLIRDALFTALQQGSSVPKIDALLSISPSLRPHERACLAQLVAEKKSSYLPSLLRTLKNPNAQLSSRKLAATIISKISLSTLKKEVEGIIQKEIDKIYFYLYHAQHVRKQLPSVNLSLLQGALYCHSRSLLEFIVTLLGTAKSLEMSEVLVQTLSSPNQKIRAQTLETIEKMCDAKLFKEIRSLHQDPFSLKLARIYLQKGFTPLKLMQLLDALEHTHSPALQAVAQTMKSRLNLVAT